MLMIWAAFIFFFFSYSSSKLPSYILPIFPALALLLANLLSTSSRKQLLLLAGSVLLLALVSAVAYSQTDLAKMAKHPLEVPIFLAFGPWIIASIVVAALGGLVALYFANKTARDHVVLALAISGFAFGQLLIQGSEAGGRYRAGFDLVPIMSANLKPEMKLYAVGLYEQCIPFYLRRTMVMVEHKDELAFGLQQQPELWLEKRSDFIDIWRKGPPAMAMMREDMFAQLQKEGVAMKVIAQDSRRIIVLNTQ
jgi:4-amino-4-deoxy-L-arabinose transferase-like glycosyltransferase